MHPAPAQSSVPLIVGGMGNTTLKIAATHADEWNSYYVSIDTYREKSQVIDKHCNSINRDPSTLRHSLMTPYVIGKNDQEIEIRRVEINKVKLQLKELRVDSTTAPS